MIVTVIVMVAVAMIAAAVAQWQRASHRPAPTTTAGVPPAWLDRTDFRSPGAPLLIAVFTSESCSSCEAVWRELAGYESAAVVTQNVEVNQDADLHRRYKIESVPTAVVVDHAGEAQAAFVGPLGPDHREALHSIVAGND